MILQVHIIVGAFYVRYHRIFSLLVIRMKEIRISVE